MNAPSLRELAEPRRQIAAALEGLKDWQIKAILEGMVTYGYRRPNGEWKDSLSFPAPFRETR